MAEIASGLGITCFSLLLWGSRIGDERPRIYIVLLKTWIEALRVTHWIKSGFCLAALFFHGDAMNLEVWIRLLPIVASFSLAASAGYLFNDLINVAEDAKHPRKRKRPVTSGRISRWAAWVASALLASLAVLLVLLFYGFGAVLMVLVGYLGVTGLYSLVFRQVPFVDVVVLGLGFVARVAGGAYALDLEPTGWLLTCTYTLALLLGFGKRKGEWLYMETHHQEVGQTRRALQGYSRKLLDVLIISCAVLAGASYVAYCLQRPDPMPFSLTAIPVVMGLMSYMWFAWRSEVVETPERLLLHSPVLIVSVLCWLGMVVIFSL